MKNKILQIINDSIAVKEKSKSLSGAIEKIALAIIKCYRAGGKVVIFGNGGSAADAQHIATEFVSRFEKERKSLCAVALTTIHPQLPLLPTIIILIKFFHGRLNQRLKKKI